MKPEIATKEDIILLVDSFYEHVRDDKTIGIIFNEIAEVDWDSHLPKMYSFWETILLGKNSFKGNPMKVHMDLSTKTEMNQKHFDTWLKMWEQTIDSLYEGEVAQEAKKRAKNIAGLMLYKIEQIQ